MGVVAHRAPLLKCLEIASVRKCEGAQGGDGIEEKKGRVFEREF